MLIIISSSFIINIVYNISVYLFIKEYIIFANDESLYKNINSSLIDIYVGDDGKLHKVKGGADSVLPFSGVKYLGQFTRDPWYNENGFIIRDAYENYKNITIDNIIVFPVSCGFYFANPHTAGGPYSIEFTYNNDTGVITDSMIGMPTQASMSIEVAKIYLIE